MNVRILVMRTAFACLATCAGCLATAPTHPEAARHNATGVRHLQAGRLRMAEAAFEVGLEYNPCFADALHNLALVVWQRGDLDRAERLEREALACRPDLVQAINGLGAIERRRGNLREAAWLFESVLEMDPGCLDARRNLILTALDLGDVDLAAEELTRLRVLAPGDPMVVDPGR